MSEAQVHVGAPRLTRCHDGFVASPRPAMSWSTTTTRRDWEQAWAEIVCERGGVSSLHRVEGPDAHRVPWPFEPVRPAEQVVLRVRVAGTDGSRSGWGPPTPAIAGFLAQDGWVAQLVAPGGDDPFLLRGTVELSDDVELALLHTTSLGVHRVHCNGRRVDDVELAPGWTSYQWRLGLCTVDVTGDVVPGTNVVGLDVGGGWFTEHFGFRDSAARFYRGHVAAAAQLVVTHRDGGTTTFVTDDGWRWSPGPVVSSSLYQGEFHDARRDQHGWDTAPFDDSSWRPVVRVDGSWPTPEPLGAPPVRRTEERAVERMITTRSGNTVLDFGQNLVGRLRITVRGQRGQEVRLRHAEVLEDGELGTRPLRNAAATDTYVLAGDGDEVWEPRWTYHGFRYAQVDGWPGTLDTADVTAVVLHTDLRRTGHFATSHPLLQRLHDNVVWSTRGNFVSIPTDCPQRDERLGWTGDLQVFAPTAAFLFDCDEFLSSWMRDVLTEQRTAGGVVPMVVPAVIPQVPGLFSPIAAWGDAITVVPFVLRERFADEALLKESLPGMRAWVDVVAERAGASALWDTGQQFGDWLDPDAPADQPGAAKADPALVATAYFQLSATLTAQAARLVGQDGAADDYSALADRIRRAFTDTYVTPRGRMVSDAPTAYALALAFDLAPVHLRAAMGERLRDLVRAAGYRISTGFVGTPLVCEALTTTGHADAASRLLLQTECPSWLYPVTMGATTVWERWDSMLPDGSINPGQMTSFNHYALGGVADWLHRVVAGLAPGAPGYRRLRVAPTPLPGLDDASARLDTTYGPAEAGWRREGDRLHVHVEVPSNTRAEVLLPSGARHEVGSGSHAWSEPAPRPVPPRVLRGLDSDLADVIDDREAYGAVLAAVAEVDPSRSESLRRNTRWVRGRTLRESLDKAPVPVLDAVSAALAALH